MSRRNVILLIIILVLATFVITGFLYFRQTENTTGGDTTGTNFFSQLNPFGTNNTSKPPVNTPPTDVSGFIPTAEEISQIKLRKVSTMSVAGFGLFTKERIKNATAVRYVAKATGNIYQTFADKIEEQKFSKTVLPKIHEAYFGNKAESVIMRYLKGDERTIETFVSTLPKEIPLPLISGEEKKEGQIYEIKGIFLPDNVQDISISPDNLKIFYLFKTGENLVGATFNFSDKKKTQIFENAFTEWNSFWPNSKIITLTTRPSYGTTGYMYTLDPVTKKLSKILGEITGLTTLVSPNGKLILYSDNNLSLFVYDISTKDASLLGVKTLPEKCVWGKNNTVVYCAVPKIIPFGQYPDSWYQGEVSFSDQIWKVDIENGNTTILVDPATITNEETIDGIKLALDEAENYLFFVNKKDSFLWQLEIK